MKDDLKDQKMVIGDKLTNEQKTEYQCKVNNEWGQYMNNVKDGFFDNNKMYIKTMHEYRTKNGIRNKRDSESIEDSFTPYRQEKMATQRV